MADLITSVIGAALMVVFLLLLAAKLNEVALWAVCLIGIALMLWAVWNDTFAPLFGRRSD
jgi:hypothetical protein